MVLFAAQGKEGFGFIPRSEAFACDGCFAVGYYYDVLLVLMEFVALGLHGEDGSKRVVVRVDGRLEGGLMGEGCLLILRRNFARSDSHDDMTYNLEGLVDVFDTCGLFAQS